MNKKGALELSINAIVILIIALVILGLIITFAVTKFGDLEKRVTFTETTPEPTGDMPITFPGGRTTIELEKKTINLMEMKVYNFGASEVDPSGASLNCIGADTIPNNGITISTAVTSVPEGKTSSVPVSIKVLGTVSPGKYGCTLSMGSSSDACVCDCKKLDANSAVLGTASCLIIPPATEYSCPADDTANPVAFTYEFNRCAGTGCTGTEADCTGHKPGTQAISRTVFLNIK